MSELTDVAKTSAKGSFFLFVGNTSSYIILAFGAIIIARLLGPENYGVYTIAFVAPTVFMALSDLGISPALTRFTAHLRSTKKYRRAAYLIKFGVLFKASLSILLALILIALSGTIANVIFKTAEMTVLIQVLSLYLIGQSVFETINSTLVGIDRTEWSAVLQNIQAVMKVASAILLLVIGLGTFGATVGAALGALVVAGVGAAFLLRTYNSFIKREHSEGFNITQGLKQMVTYGMPLYASGLLMTILAQYQMLILTLFVSYSEIGNWSVAMNFTILVTLISAPIATSLFPAFSKIRVEEDRESVEKMFKLSIKYTSLFVIPASLAVGVLSKYAVYTLYGSQYSSAPSYLSLYTLSFLCVGLGSVVTGNFFNGQGDTKTSFKLSLVNFALSIVLTPMLTLTFQVEGLIASVIISKVASATYGLQTAHKKYGMNLEWIPLLKILVASLSSAFITFIPIEAINLNPFYGLISGGILYILSFLVLTPLIALSKDDLENLDGLFQEFPIIYPLIKRVFNFESGLLKIKQSL